MWFFDPDPIKGREIGHKIRPCIIVSHKDFSNGPSGLVIVIPCTTSNHGIASHVQINPPEGGFKKVSFAMTEQIRAISRVRLSNRIGTISLLTMEKIEDWVSDLLDLH